MSKIDKVGHAANVGGMNVSLGKLEAWVKDQVKHGDYATDSEVVREAVRRMKESQPSEPAELQRMMDAAESSGFKEMSVDDWNKLRRLAKSKLAK
jgi:putative addiction module antidote protein, CC2985 family